MTGSPPSPDDAEALARFQLRALSDSYPSMPTEVAQRLDRTLAELPDLAAPDTTPAPRPARKWWQRRFALVWAMMAAVVVLAGVGVIASQPWMNQQSTGSEDGAAADSREGTSDDADGNDEPKAESSQELAGSPDAGAEEEGGYALTYTGRDYDADTLSDAVGPNETGSKSLVDPALSTLVNGAAERDACLASVQAEYAGEVAAVDFGSFEADPAMIAVITDSDGASNVVAVGPECGSSTMDEIASDRV